MRDREGDTDDGTNTPGSAHLAAYPAIPLIRLIVLGGGVFYLMGWTEARIVDFKDTPVIGVGIAIVLALAAIAIYIAWGKLIERREVTELSLPGVGREWAIGALIGAGLYTGCVLLLMAFGMFTIEGSTPYPS